MALQLNDMQSMLDNKNGISYIFTNICEICKICKNMCMKNRQNNLEISLFNGHHQFYMLLASITMKKGEQHIDECLNRELAQ